MVTTKYKRFFDRLLEPLAEVFIHLRFSPNQITLLGFILGILICIWYLLTRKILLFCVLITIAALFDVLDGAVARKTGKITKFGSYLDAMCDRFFEGFVALTVAIVTGHWILIGLAIVGATGISYAKARAALEVPVSNMEWPDLMERAERDIVFMGGFVLSELSHANIAGRDLFFWVLVFLNIALYFTVVQRILRAKRLIETRGSN